MAAQGMPNDQTAARRRCGRDVASQSRIRFFLARRSSIELTRAVAARQICEEISDMTVRRRLSENAIRRWQFYSWIFLPDPVHSPGHADRGRGRRRPGGNL